MTPPTLDGPLSAADLQAIWESSVDDLFAQPLLEKGDGFGIEAYGQMFAQLERVSQAVDVTTQAMYILPSSGQTNPPSQGEAFARVTLTFSRTKRVERPLVVTGSVWVEEETTDWGELPGDGGQVVRTGRRYRVLDPVAFLPGSLGPISALAEAEAPGWGYNNPQPGTISAIDQVGSDFDNVRASVATFVASAAIVAAPEADTFVPDQVGQYFQLTAGANAGKIVRAVGYVRPSPADGGSILVAREVAFEGVRTGTFAVGELVAQATSGATGTYLGSSAKGLVVAWVSGTFTGAATITGAASTATFAPTAKIFDEALTAEVGTAAWRSYGWVADAGLVVTNAASPAGGRLGFLDELGHERNVKRGPREGDDQYRGRVSKIGDVVSPGAVQRAANRALAPYGLDGCLREAGAPTLPGFYYDRNDGHGDWYDMESFTFPGGGAFAFFPGEVVTQVGPTGQVATGHAIVNHLHAGLGAESALIFVGIAAGRGTFVDSLPIVGARSKTSYTPTVVAGGFDHSLRYRYVFDAIEMRAFFLIAVPPANFGEFGLAWDQGAYDGSPYLTFFDGYPAGAAGVYSTVWQEVDRIHAGGVGFDLVRDGAGCA